MKKPYDYVDVTINKRDAEIVTGLILREIEELAKMKATLEGRGFTLLTDIKCRQIDLKYLLETFSKAAE